tara:strand:- start:536 stop:862 length:327 start_codon:yes stop_codon:yes gene_type:complete
MDNTTFSIGEIVNIERHENKGDADRIPHSYRSYINDNNYMYKGVIVNLGMNANHFRVRPVPINYNYNTNANANANANTNTNANTNANTIINKCSTRKATKTKTHKIEL